MSNLSFADHFKAIRVKSGKNPNFYLNENHCWNKYSLNENQSWNKYSLNEIH